ncbi:MAG: hypothetical protein M0R06_22125 [Sphaerochaeta sp.]|nr:hypothetical protein [Sphaerochaeta sp.]
MKRFSSSETFLGEAITASEIYGLSMVYDDGYKLVVTEKTDGIIRARRYIIVAGTWSAGMTLDFGAAITSSPILIQNYVADYGVGDLRQVYDEYMKILDPGQYQKVHDIYNRGYWSSTPYVIQQARATNNLDLDAPFLCKISANNYICSLYKNKERWFFRSKVGEEFYDGFWDKYSKLGGECTYGLALAHDGTYLWASRPSEVWRCKIPGDCWSTPTIGTGDGSSDTIASTDIMAIHEKERAHHESVLYVTLDNSQGTYDSLPGTYIKRGSKIAIQRGINTNYTSANTYFIEQWFYRRAAGRAYVVLYCVDAWGLMERSFTNGPSEYNLASNEKNVYELIEKCIKCIGGTISYVSRSSDIVNLYPKMEIRAGECVAEIMRRLLSLVPDIIYFDGLAGYIMLPTIDESHCYGYHF